MRVQGRSGKGFSDCGLCIIAHDNPHLKGNSPLSTQNVVRTPLHISKPHSPTALAFQMSEKRRETNKFLSAATAKTPVEFLLMDKTREMLIQDFTTRKTAMAEVAFVRVTVPACCGCGPLLVGRVVPS